MGRPVLKDGAILRFYFSTYPPLEGRLRWTPSATGDSWIIESNDQTFYIQQFDWMEVLSNESGET